MANEIVNIPSNLSQYLATFGTNTNLNNSTPVAPGGNTNVTWQTDEFGNISAYTQPGATGPTGATGAQGPPGEVTNAQLASLAAVVSITTPFAGKTIWVTGDSVTFGGLYDPSLISVTQASSIQAKMGGGGVSMQGAFLQAVIAQAANPSGPSVVQLVANSLAGASLVLVAMGGNNGGTPIGAISDPPTVANDGSSDSVSFYGDCKMVANMLESAIAINAPSVMPTIVVATPYLQSRVTGTLLDNITTALQQVFGGLYGYPVCVLSTNSGINPNNWATTLSDTVHVTTFGGNMIGSSLGRFANAHAHQ